MGVLPGFALPEVGSAAQRFQPLLCHKRGLAATARPGNLTQRRKGAKKGAWNNKYPVQGVDCAQRDITVLCYDLSALQSKIVNRKSKIPCSRAGLANTKYSIV
jgi:hypothetical protein